jgi:16S rRNA (uracil1498-N3)-methyltransferase
VLGEEPPSGVSPCRITLAMAVLKGDKMDLVVQKATELGADAIVPIMAKRSVPRWSPAQAAERAERWARIAESASDQCERSLPPRVDIPRPLATALELPAPAFLLHERDGMPIAAAVRRWPTLEALALYIGPEGGWDPAEVDRLTAAGVCPLHLGGRILRAETAAIAALTIAQLVWGDLGGA